jgi:hypothetical protein
MKSKTDVNPTADRAGPRNQREKIIHHYIAFGR